MDAARLLLSAEPFPIVLREDEQHQRVDAAVHVAEADGDVVGVDEHGGGLDDAQVHHLDDVEGRPAQEEDPDDHHHRFGGPPGRGGLLALHAAHRAEHVEEGE